MEMHSRGEELQRQRDALQKQRDLFEQYRSECMQKLQQKASQLEQARAPAEVFNRAHSSIWENVVHRRSASDDLHDSAKSDMMSQENSNILQEPLNRKSDTIRKATRTASTSSLGASATSIVRRESQVNLPIHLMSATNEQKMGTVTSQHLPHKLSTLGSGSKTATASPPSVQQVLPTKLSNLTTGSQPNSSTSESGGQSKRAVPPNTPRLQISKSQPQLQLGSTGLAKQNSGSFLPMKLAEKTRTPKSVSSPPVTPGKAHPQSAPVLATTTLPLSPNANDSQHSQKAATSPNANREEIFF